jgi:hypothetical protein
MDTKVTRSKNQSSMIGDILKSSADVLHGKQKADEGTSNVIRKMSCDGKVSKSR